MNRKTVAFIVAPLWVPLVFAPLAQFVIFPYPGQGLAVTITVFLAAIFSYGGMILFGIPAFRLFRAHHLTSCWIAGFVGFFIAVIVSLLFFFLFGISLGNGVGDSLLGSLSASATWVSVGGTGPMGILVGITLWLIARPDRN